MREYNSDRLPIYDKGCLEFYLAKTIAEGLQGIFLGAKDFNTGKDEPADYGYVFGYNSTDKKLAMEEIERAERLFETGLRKIVEAVL